MDITFDPDYLDSFKSVEAKAKAVSDAAYIIALKYFDNTEGAKSNEL